MLSRNDLKPVVQKLIDSGFSFVQHDDAHGVLNSNNIYPVLRPFFTKRAGKILHVKVRNLIHSRNEECGHEGVASLLHKLQIKAATVKLESGQIGWHRVMDMVNFFGLTADEHNVDAAIAKTINTINDLAERGYITGAMAPLSIIQLQTTDFFSKSYCIVSYLAVNSAGQLYVDSNLQDMIFKEGGTPLAFKDKV